MCSAPGRVREHLEDVALREALPSERRVGDLEGLRLRPDRLPPRLDRLRVVRPSPSSSPGTKKPLAREAGGSPRPCRARFLGYGRSCCTSRKRYQAESGDARALPRFGAHRAGCALARWRAAAELASRFGTPLVVYCEETIRAQARSLREAAPGSARRLRLEGVPERRRPAAARRGRRRRRRLHARRARASRARPGSPATDSSCTGTTSRTRSCARRPMPARSSSSTRSRRSSAQPRGRRRGTSSSASRPASRPTRTRRSAPATTARSSGSPPTTRSSASAPRWTPTSTSPGVHVHVGSQLADVRRARCSPIDWLAAFAARVPRRARLDAARRRRRRRARCRHLAGRARAVDSASSSAPSLARSTRAGRLHGLPRRS